ncbi:hypothetical protein DACRYDRAFT_24884 [Dacryopinax primogenitus]|uniref:Uncharacterized protein n=1 Tax=Dacryopinax primogenitus (strain DJM 731) TaxID=1858805 RepID=M5FNV7_DACPD|nr:uncharacterized protein DACRYDRAFT_24884 [Dacryopinax primogenitus]EJT97975.1 hypothetical protein DACRYDRAFT_24884 [Dacryopinax primogenitus]
MLSTSASSYPSTPGQPAQSRQNTRTHSRLRTSKSAFSLEGLGFTTPKLPSSRTQARLSAVVSSDRIPQFSNGHGRTTSLSSSTTTLPLSPTSLSSPPPSASSTLPTSRTTTNLRFWRGKKGSPNLAPIDAHTYTSQERGRAFSPELAGVQEGPSSPCSIIVIQPPSPSSSRPSSRASTASFLSTVSSRLIPTSTRKPRTRSMSPVARQSPQLDDVMGEHGELPREIRKRSCKGGRASPNLPDEMDPHQHPYASAYSSSSSSGSTSRPSDGRRPSVSSVTSSVSAYSQEEDATAAYALGVGLGLTFPRTNLASSSNILTSTRKKRMSLAPSTAESLGSMGSSRSGTPSLELPSPRSSSVASYSPPTPGAEGGVFRDMHTKSASINRIGRTWDVPLELGGLTTSDTARTITQASLSGSRSGVAQLSSRASNPALTRSTTSAVHTPKATTLRRLPSLTSPTFPLRPVAGFSARPGSPAISAAASLSSTTPTSTLPRSRTLTRSLSRKRSDSILTPAKAPPAGPLPSVPPVPKVPALPSPALTPALLSSKDTPSPSPATPFPEADMSDLLERFPLPPGSKRFSGESDSSIQSQRSGKSQLSVQSEVSEESELLTPGTTLDLTSLPPWEHVSLFSTDYAEPVPPSRPAPQSQPTQPPARSNSTWKGKYVEDVLEEEREVHPFARSGATGIARTRRQSQLAYL